MKLGRLRKFAASVSRLFLASSPSNVSRRVISVVVNAFYRVGRGRTRADVREPSLETGAPFLGHLNSPTAVAVEILDVGIRAPGLHSRPNPVFGCSAPHRRLAMSCPVGMLGLKASAASRISVLEFVDGNYSRLPTRARANPFRAGGPLGPMKGLQAPKHLPGKVQSFHKKHLTRRDCVEQGAKA